MTSNRNLLAHRLLGWTISVLFCKHDLPERPHVHVERDEMTAKFWLEPIRLARSLGFAPHELNRLESLVTERRDQLLEA